MAFPKSADCKQSFACPFVPDISRRENLPDPDDRDALGRVYLIFRLRCSSLARAVLFSLLTLVLDVFSRRLLSTAARRMIVYDSGKTVKLLCFMKGSVMKAASKEVSARGTYRYRASLRSLAVTPLSCASQVWRCIELVVVSSFFLQFQTMRGRLFFVVVFDIRRRCSPREVIFAFLLSLVLMLNRITEFLTSDGISVKHPFIVRRRIWLGRLICATLQVSLDQSVKNPGVLTLLIASVTTAAPTPIPMAAWSRRCGPVGRYKSSCPSWPSCW